MHEQEYPLLKRLNQLCGIHQSLNSLAPTFLDLIFEGKVYANFNLIQ